MIISVAGLCSWVLLFEHIPADIGQHFCLLIVMITKSEHMKPGVCLLTNIAKQNKQSKKLINKTKQKQNMYHTLKSLAIFQPHEMPNHYFSNLATL